jgi:Imelysin
MSCAAPATNNQPASQPTAAVPVDSSQDTAELSEIKSYLLSKLGELKTHVAALKAASDQYYALAQTANFDYAALWANQPSEAVAALEQARAAWVLASPGYERIEGIVAGVPSLATYDMILDAGVSGAEGGESVVPFDLTLPDGQILSKPGNLFGVTESTLWGTFAEFSATEVEADFNGDGKVEFGEALANANVLKAGVDAMAHYVAELEVAASAWQPTTSDAFTALVRMVPTMTEYFNSWKNSRFVVGEATTQRDFVAISRLADIQDILSSLQVVYTGVKPLVNGADPQQAEQVEQRLADLKQFVAEVYQKEQNGQRFTPEDADLLGEEAQNRATAITGQITQLAAQLNVPIEE